MSWGAFVVGYMMGESAGRSAGSSSGGPPANIDLTLFWLAGALSEALIARLRRLLNSDFVRSSQAVNPIAFSRQRVITRSEMRHERPSDDAQERNMRNT